VAGRNGGGLAGLYRQRQRGRYRARVRSGHSNAQVAAHLRRLRLRALRDRLQESLLFLPALMLLASAAVAFVLAEIDTRRQSRPLPWTFSFAPGTASTLLGTIAGATITTAGVVFSLLVVSLQLASGQFSPRVLRGFWRDQFGQVLVGLLLSTFAFCVLALARLDPHAARAPALTVMFALLLALASVVFIVVYLDRISRRAVIAGAPAGSVVRLETRVGGYLVRDTPVASIWPRPADPAAVAALIRAAVILGPARTMQQDIDFGLRQLNDIALRALSPAVNDPTTAIEVVLRIGSIMRPLVLAELPGQSVRDSAGRVLLTPFDLDHAEYIGHAFDQLRVYAAAHPQVLMAIARTQRMLRGACLLAGGKKEVITALDQQLALIVACCAPEMLPEARARVEDAAATGGGAAG